MRALNTPRVWISGAGLVGLLLIAATWLLVIAPARSDAASIRSKVDDSTLVQTTLRHKLADLEAASKDIGSLRTADAAAASAIPATADTQGLLRRLQTTAAAQRVVVGSVAISAAEETDVVGVWGLPVTVELDGAPADLVAVVQSLQSTSGRALTIAGTTLDVVSAGAATLSLDVTMYSTSAPLATDGTVATPAGAPAGGTAAGAPSTTATTTDS